MNFNHIFTMKKGTLHKKRARVVFGKSVSSKVPSTGSGPRK